MLHVVERKRSKPTNTGCRGGFSYSLSANCNFPLTRDMTTFWVLFALLITFRHARRFVCACFPRKQATDHNHSTNRNRSSEQTNIQCSYTSDRGCMRTPNHDLWIVECDQCKQVFRQFALIHAEWKKNRGVSQALRCLAR